MKRLWLLLAFGFLALAFLLMVADAAIGGDWPGWDEGWAVVVFPLGIPAAAAAGLAVSAPGLRWMTLAVTLAVWTWGGAVFVLWHLLG